MTLQFKFPTKIFNYLKNLYHTKSYLYFVLTAAIFVSILATTYFYFTDALVAYGDTESHLNIAKRVIHSITPGAAQLGGIWLPLPHILLIPFVYFDFLWRSGLAGSIVSGISFVITTVYIYKLTYLLTNHKLSSIFASYAFIVNPNVLYLQSTAMTELVLIVFFILSSYYFIKFVKNTKDILSLLFAAFFGFCSVLSRYDGWFLVGIESVIIVIVGLVEKWKFRKIEGILLLYGTLAFFGVVLWLFWDQLILGNALYFTQSEFSAKTQQQAWFAKGELPAYHNVLLSFLYYLTTILGNSGIFVFALAVVGLYKYFTEVTFKVKYFALIVLFVPLIFNIFTLYIGQSVIFIPHLTPVDFEWNLFNVRYGVMMIPTISILIGILFYTYRKSGRLFIITIFLAQFALFYNGYTRVLALQDGIEGLSHSKRPDAEKWMKDHYDGGLVLLDDYARTISIIRSGIKMQDVIYIGNKPYWEESLDTPDKHAKWIVMQKSDAVWVRLEENEVGRGRLYTHFQKVYTSPDILIFKRNE